ncbi:MAG: HEAT repeat domain-containing protein [Armatimonadota bacterium]
MDNSQLNRLLAQTSDWRWAVRLDALQALAPCADARILPVLIGLLGDPDARVRERVVELLGERGDRDAVPHLCNALSDWSWHVCEKAAVALGRLGDPRAVPFLISALEKRTCPAVAVALGRLGDARAIPALCEAAGPERPTATRRAAFAALAKLDDSAAVEPLCQALRDPDEQVRIAAARALGDLAERTGAGALRAALPPLRRRLRWLTGESDEYAPFRDSIDRIEAATSGVKALPVPSRSRTGDASELPLPAGTTPELEGRPLPGEPNRSTGELPPDESKLSGSTGDALRLLRGRWPRKR